MTEYVATNAASSGIKIDKKRLKQLMRRSDRPALTWLALWVAFLGVSGFALFLSLGTAWVIPATLVYGSILTLPSYALSHECAHGTAFRTRWVNELLFWISSLLYFEEPYHRRYSHARHHTYTWIEGMDSQMPFATPMTFRGWLIEVSGLGLILYETPIFFRNALGLYSDQVRDFTPASELPKLKWGARACLAVYAALAAPVFAGYWWPLTFIIIPRLAGGPFMLLVTLIQHVEMKENSTNILESTRSFRTGWLGRFLYMNMNHHIEHHLYPLVPFHQLPGLSQEIDEQLPHPDPGILRTNLEVLLVVIRRSLGLSTKAPTIRQAPHMTVPAAQSVA
jgi:fatty acid desaturase